MSTFTLLGPICSLHAKSLEMLSYLLQRRRILTFTSSMNYWVSMVPIDKLLLRTIKRALKSPFLLISFMLYLLSHHHHLLVKTLFYQLLMDGLMLIRTLCSTINTLTFMDSEIFVTFLQLKQPLLYFHRLQLWSKTLRDQWLIKTVPCRLMMATPLVQSSLEAIN